LTSHLVCGDPHADPDEDNRRFDWLGKFIVDEQPEVVVCMGDFADMGSLSSYDKGKRSFEGRSFKRDCEAVHDALARINAPLEAYNARRRAYKEKQYKPRRVMLYGNHDQGRIEKTVELSRELEDTVDISCLRYEDFGWEVVPYGKPVEIDGIHYCHHFPSGNNKFPISGLNMGRKLVLTNHASSTVGHSHLLDVHCDVGLDGKKIWGLSAGCYFEHTPSYAGESSKIWWRGLIMKRNVVDGDYDPEFISIRTLQERYGV
jgi:hypothetical protein